MERVPVHKAGLQDVKAAQAVLARNDVIAEITKPPGCKTSS